MGIDESGEALRALDWAAEEATRRDAPLHVLHASRWEHYEVFDAAGSGGHGTVEPWGEHLVKGASERVRAAHPALEIIGDVLPLRPEEAFLAADDRCSAIVLGYQGRGKVGSLLVGSVSLAVAAHARCPVVVTRGPGDPPGASGGEVLLALGAHDIDPAVTFAFEEAALQGLPLHALHAVSRQHQGERLWHEALREAHARHPTVDVRCDVVDDEARRRLVAESASSALLVLGARRRSGHVGPLLGPITNAALHHARCPVAVVPV
ncbi:universal stress protein [Streptomyces sp. ICBB 8177]|uniref:universal stress protein n=1 Tax=Streptomyces sp. ICBB 8177 TaxID=563922 RepID=UPI00130507AD|nr:universal stress protein [Streptomyces sp. ICBB 8177]